MTGRRRKPGRMGPFIEGCGSWLAGRGYTPGTTVNVLAMAGGLGRWMDGRGIAPCDLDPAMTSDYAMHSRAAGMQYVPALTGLDPCWRPGRPGRPAARLPRPRHQSRCWRSVPAGGL